MSSARRPRPIEQEPLQDLARWYPRVRPPNADPDLFEIGLVLAGGQSAGAYLAGVLDFLFEALDAWHEALEADQATIPNHRVRIRVVVGTSAGGLSSALVGVCAPYRFGAARQVDFARGDENLRSPFYRAWVRDIDISNLLALDDLQAGEPLSVVNAAYLSRKLHEYLDFTGDGRATAAQRAWLSDPLRLKITNTNVNGTTYGIRFTQDPGRDPQDQIGHAMTTHADHLAFRRPTFLNPDGPAPPDHEPLGRDNRATDDGWARLGQAGLASLAFPGVLGMQTVERPNTDYEYRFVFADGPDRLVYARPVPHQPPGQTRFSVLDGGLVNNEPFDLAHAALAGSEGHNPRLGADAHRAVVMVDPFVNPPPHPDGPTPLLQLPLRLYEAFTQQSRFKPIDLALAQSDEVYSRFLIAPVRRARARTIRGDDALASRPLGTLMGYFCEQYRHHDFMLGRQNCYRFLRNWFCLPSGEEAGTGDAGASPRGNSLFDAWPAAALANPAFRSQVSTDHRQIIPLVAAAAAEPPAPRWPAGAFAGWTKVAPMFEARLDALYPRLKPLALQALVTSGFWRAVAGVGVALAWRLGGRRAVLGRLRTAIEEARAQIDAAAIQP